jgi:hypothetical protein
MSIQSASALAKCMESLEIPRTASTLTRLEAIIDVPKYHLRGPVVVEFHPDAGTGPYLSLGPTVRGFGIAVDEFRPGTARMRFDKRSHALRVSHDDYDFVLEFARLPGG